jgi:hypothetical protein
MVKSLVEKLGENRPRVGDIIFHPTKKSWFLILEEERYRYVVHMSWLTSEGLQFFNTTIAFDGSVAWERIL